MYKQENIGTPPANRDYVPFRISLQEQYGPSVVVNLRPDPDVEAKFVGFERPRVVRVLERMAADLDNLSLVPNGSRADKESTNHDPQACHRHKLAAPPPKPKKLSHRAAGGGIASSAGTTATVRTSQLFTKLTASTATI